MDLKIFTIDSECTGCGACTSICPRSCIDLKPDKEGFYYPQKVNENCIGCKLCEKVCHVLNPISSNHIPQGGFVMYQNEDDHVIEASSSGGVFTILAEHTIKNGGIVFGSWFNPVTERLEVSSSDIVDWHLFRKSKYVETFQNGSFNSVVDHLKNGKDVLYCSTPCQIRGLIQFLTKKNINRKHLTTIDLICHGVPSMDHFGYFYRRHVNRSKALSDLNFRYKDFKTKKHMWHNPAIVFNYKDGSRDVFSTGYPTSFQYIRLFDDNLSLRKSCYGCIYPELSYSDFTIADFWGINEYKPQKDDNRGISLAKINTQKASKLWDLIEKKGYTEQIEDKYGKYVYIKNDKRPLRPARDKFFQQALRWGYLPAVFLTYKKSLLIAYLKYWVKILIGRKIN